MELLALPPSKAISKMWLKERGQAHHLLLKLSQVALSSTSINSSSSRRNSRCRHCGRRTGRVALLHWPMRPCLALWARRSASMALVAAGNTVKMQTTGIRASRARASFSARRPSSISRSHTCSTLTSKSTEAAVRCCPQASYLALTTRSITTYIIIITTFSTTYSRRTM